MFFWNPERIELFDKDLNSIINYLPFLKNEELLQGILIIKDRNSVLLEDGIRIELELISVKEKNKYYRANYSYPYPESIL